MFLDESLWWTTCQDTACPRQAKKLARDLQLKPVLSNQDIFSHNLQQLYHDLIFHASFPPKPLNFDSDLPNTICFKKLLEEISISSSLCKKIYCIPRYSLNFY